MSRELIFAVSTLAALVVLISAIIASVVQDWRTISKAKKEAKDERD